MEQATGYIVLSWFYITVTFFLVINRLHVRALQSRRHGWLSNCSDGLVVVAWIFNVFQCGCDLVIYCEGLMTTASKLDPMVPADIEKITTLSKIMYTELIIYYVSLYSIKGALLCFLLELTPPILREIRRAIWTGVGLVACGITFTVSGYIFSCWPISYTSMDKKCKIFRYTATVSVCYHMFTDIYIYVIPLFLTSKLEIISRSQRIATATMFGAGLVVLLLAVPQLVCNWVPGMWNPFMWQFWCCIHEQNLAVAVACLPAARVTAQRWRRGGGPHSWRNSGVRGFLATREVAGTGVSAPAKSEVPEHSIALSTLTNTISNGSANLHSSESAEDHAEHVLQIPNF